MAGGPPPTKANDSPMVAARATSTIRKGIFIFRFLSKKGHGSFGSGRDAAPPHRCLAARSARFRVTRPLGVAALPPPPILHGLQLHGESDLGCGVASRASFPEASWLRRSAGPGASDVP